MPRPPRLIVDGGYYHIVTRGNDRRIIFCNPEDYQFFIDVAISYLNEYQLKIIHYCLMPNHLHYLMQVAAGKDLSKFMQVVLQVYANYFKKRYPSTGHVFESRFRARHIKNDAYLMDCGRYIERNPLRAGLVTDLNSYRWSSFRFYAKGAPNKLIVGPDPLYDTLSKTDFERQAIYAKRVIEPRPYEEILEKEFKI